MALMTKTLWGLLPKKIFGGELVRQSIDGIAVSLGRVRTRLHGVLDEMNPSTAVETIDDWAEMLQVPPGVGNTGITESFTAMGGQDHTYLEGKIQAEYPDLDVTVNGVYDYTIEGDVPTSFDFTRVKSIIARYFPLYDVPAYNMRTLENLAVARCGLGVTGEARTGKKEP